MEPLDLVLSACRLAPAGRLADIGIRGGRIAAIGDLAEVSARRRLPAGGRLLTSGFVDAHVHLDKAYLLDRAPSGAGALAEAIRVTAGAKRAFTVEDIRARARALLDRAVAAGTTAMRGHVEVVTRSCAGRLSDAPGRDAYPALPGPMRTSRSRPGPGRRREEAERLTAEPTRRRVRSVTPLSEPGEAHKERR